MPRGVHILLHTAAAGAFVFILQRFALNQSVETARAWALVFGIGAAALAWKQTER